MPSVSFSLTEKAIIDPILTLCAPLPPLEPDQTVSWTATVWQGIQSELIARIIAMATSVFAAVDTLIHFATGMFKGACLLARISYNKSAVYTHFRQVTWFAGLTIAGSIAGIIWPGIFKHCRYSPSAPSYDFPDAPSSIQKLATAVQTNRERAPFTQLKQSWNQSSLEEKHWLVQIFNHDGPESFKTVRAALASTVYQPVQHLRNRQVQWLSSKEVDQRACNIWQRSFDEYSFFYHATSERALESILKSKKVEVRHEKAFRGAFVSTKPEIGFGRCILAFKKNIERLSPLEHGFEIGINTYWAGFSRNIPVTDSTLAYIMLDGGSYEECQRLETCCQQWAGRPIKVISLNGAETYLKSIQKLNMGIPSEWPSEDKEIGQKILNTLRARAAIAVQVAQGAAQMQRVGQRQPMMLASF